MKAARLMKSRLSRAFGIRLKASVRDMKLFWLSGMRQPVV